MSEESEVIYVSGLARMLGKTESAIREGIRRGAPWLPPSFRVGVYHAWLKDDVRTFLRECAQGQHVKVKTGRKRNPPPSLRGVA